LKYRSGCHITPFKPISFVDNKVTLMLTKRTKPTYPFFAILETTNSMEHHNVSNIVAFLCGLGVGSYFILLPESFYLLLFQDLTDSYTACLLSVFVSTFIVVSFYKFTQSHHPIV
jgi:hypothetical protein